MGGTLARLAYAQQRALESGDPRLRGERAAVVKANALRAIQMDPSLSMSYTALAAVQAYHDWDFPAAESTLRQGLAVLPQNGAAHSRLALLLAAAGRLDEAISEAEKARNLEPLVPERVHDARDDPLLARDFDQCTRRNERALDVSPNYCWRSL